MGLSLCGFQTISESVVAFDKRKQTVDLGLDFWLPDYKKVSPFDVLTSPFLGHWVDPSPYIIRLYFNNSMQSWLNVEGSMCVVHTFHAPILFGFFMIVISRSVFDTFFIFSVIIWSLGFTGFFCFNLILLLFLSRSYSGFVFPQFFNFLSLYINLLGCFVNKELNCIFPFYSFL